MSSFEKGRKAMVATIAALAATAVAGDCSAARNPSAVKIDHTIKEPVCTGVTIEQIDHDNFYVEPVLSKPFSYPENVLTYLEIETSPSNSSTSSSGMVNTSGGGAESMQNGVGYVVGLQTGSQVPARLEMFDYQANTPPSVAGNYVPANVPEVVARRQISEKGSSSTCKLVRSSYRSVQTWSSGGFFWHAARPIGATLNCSSLM